MTLNSPMLIECILFWLELAVCHSPHLKSVVMVMKIVMWWVSWQLTWRGFGGACGFCTCERGDLLPPPDSTVAVMMLDIKLRENSNWCVTGLQENPEIQKVSCTPDFVFMFFGCAHVGWFMGRRGRVFPFSFLAAQRWHICGTQEPSGPLLWWNGWGSFHSAAHWAELVLLHHGWTAWQKNYS